MVKTGGKSPSVSNRRTENHFEIHKPRAFSITEACPLREGTLNRALFDLGKEYSGEIQSPLPFVSQIRGERKNRRLRNASEGHGSPGTQAHYKRTLNHQDHRTTHHQQGSSEITVVMTARHRLRESS